MPKYQNVAFSQGKSAFTDAVTGTTVTFASKTAQIRPSGNPVSMVSFDVLLEVPKNVSDPACDPCANVDVNTSLRVKGNLVKGDADSLSDMRAELARLFTIALEDQHLLEGFVPTSNNNFATP